MTSQDTFLRFGFPIGYWDSPTLICAKPPGGILLAVVEGLTEVEEQEPFMTMQNAYLATACRLGRKLRIANPSTKYTLIIIKISVRKSREVK